MKPRATTHTEPVVTTVTAVVSVRIPDGADGDITTEAKRRLEAIEGIRTVSIDGLRGLDPHLSATVVTVISTIEFRGTTDQLRKRLTETIYVDTIYQM